ncbi:MAG: GAF domain-containing protein [Chloroflexota bacterium]|nr:GAF domain-containing protein [Chloroflexota bacterium]MBI5704229.1 GAF domain-containing protein [Chloroflexota bacterium]
MPETAVINSQLKEASQLTGAAWSALVEQEAGKWRVTEQYRLGKKSQSVLVKFLEETEVNTWLSGALSGGVSRSVSLPASTPLKAGRLYAFPLPGMSHVVLVGAAQLSLTAQRIWRLAAAAMRPETRSAEPSPASSVAASLLMPDLNAESPYDLPRAIHRALDAFIRLVPVQGAWFAIRRADSLEIRAQWNAPAVADLLLSMDAHSLLRRMNRNLTPVTVQRGDALWAQIPHKGLKASTKAWICVPLVIGQRMIGAVGMWRSFAFKAEEWKRLVDLANQIAPALETLITIAEMAGHLRRLAMLNDFALTVSTGRSLDQIARRMFALLSRAFGTELIMLDLFSSNEQVVQEYRMEGGNLVSILRGTEGHPISRLFSGDQMIRLSEAGTDSGLPLYTGALSGIYVPLRLRGQPIGALSVESRRRNAFSPYDESLLTVLASHLASLADYTRVREEAEGRARNLGVIHEVVQQIVGLTDPRQVAEATASLLARYFSYELTAVFIADENGDLTIGGLGGVSPNVVKRAMKSITYPLRGGIAGYVFESGRGLLVNDVLQDERYTPIKGWQAGSEMCVPIRDASKVLGVINVESSSRNAFTHNDYIALESLAGILAAVITSADQYQRLQETIYQLRETEMELNARMEAQRLAENRLVQAAKLAAVGEMAAGIAHELNNPLTSVTGFAELVMNDLPADSPLRADLDLVIREARRARDVVRRLLDFARQSESARANASLNKVVEDVVALTRHLLHTNGVELLLHLQDDLPWVSMDENQMKQVLLNLVHNALQAMPDGGKLEIRTAVSSKVGREGVIVSVRDSGVGIPPEIQTRIFEPFFTTKASRGGTGLGLSVTYGIVSAHGGEIELISQPGAGSTFTVWLPKG